MDYFDLIFKLSLGRSVPSGSNLERPTELVTRTRVADLVAARDAGLTDKPLCKEWEWVRYRYLAKAANQRWDAAVSEQEEALKELARQKRQQQHAEFVEGRARGQQARAARRAGFENGLHGLRAMTDLALPDASGEDLIRDDFSSRLIVRPAEEGVIYDDAFWASVHTGSSPVRSEGKPLKRQAPRRYVARVASFIGGRRFWRVASAIYKDGSSGTHFIWRWASMKQRVIRRPVEPWQVTLPRPDLQEIRFFGGTVPLSTPLGIQVSRRSREGDLNLTHDKELAATRLALRKSAKKTPFVYKQQKVKQFTWGKENLSSCFLPRQPFEVGVNKNFKTADKENLKPSAFKVAMEAKEKNFKNVEIEKPPHFTVLNRVAGELATSLRRCMHDGSIVGKAAFSWYRRLAIETTPRQAYERLIAELPAIKKDRAAEWLVWRRNDWRQTRLAEGAPVESLPPAYSFKMARSAVQADIELNPGPDREGKRKAADEGQDKPSPKTIKIIDDDIDGVPACGHTSHTTMAGRQWLGYCYLRLFPVSERDHKCYNYGRWPKLKHLWQDDNLAVRAGRFEKDDSLGTLHVVLTGGQPLGELLQSHNCERSFWEYEVGADWPSPPISPSSEPDFVEGECYLLMFRQEWRATARQELGRWPSLVECLAQPQWRTDTTWYAEVDLPSAIIHVVLVPTARAITASELMERFMTEASVAHCLVGSTLGVRPEIKITSQFRRTSKLKRDQADNLYKQVAAISPELISLPVVIDPAVNGYCYLRLFPVAYAKLFSMVLGKDPLLYEILQFDQWIIARGWDYEPRDTTLHIFEAPGYGALESLQSYVQSEPLHLLRTVGTYASISKDVVIDKLSREILRLKAQLRRHQAKVNTPPVRGGVTFARPLSVRPAGLQFGTSIAAPLVGAEDIISRLRKGIRDFTHQDGFQIDSETPDPHATCLQVDNKLMIAESTIATFDHSTGFTTSEGTKPHPSCQASETRLLSTQYALDNVTERLESVTETVTMLKAGVVEFNTLPLKATRPSVLRRGFLGQRWQVSLGGKLVAHTTMPLLVSPPLPGRANRKKLEEVDTKWYVNRCRLHRLPIGLWGHWVKTNSQGEWLWDKHGQPGTIAGIARNLQAPTGAGWLETENTHFIVANSALYRDQLPLGGLRLSPRGFAIFWHQLLPHRQADWAKGMQRLTQDIRNWLENVDHNMPDATEYQIQAMTPDATPVSKLRPTTKQGGSRILRHKREGTTSFETDDRLARLRTWYEKSSPSTLYGVAKEQFGSLWTSCPVEYRQHMIPLLTWVVSKQFPGPTSVNMSVPGSVEWSMAKKLSTELSLVPPFKTGWLDFLTGKNDFVKDLTTEGIEPNPGPSMLGLFKIEVLLGIITAFWGLWFFLEKQVNEHVRSRKMEPVPFSDHMIPASGQVDNVLGIAAHGTRGDHVPLKFLARIANGLGVPVHLHSVKEMNADELEAVEEGRLWEDAPSWFKLHAFLKQGYHRTLVPYVDSHKNWRIEMGAGPEWINPLTCGNGNTRWDWVAVQCYKLLTRVYTPLLRVGNIQGCNVPRSSDGITELRPPKDTRRKTNTKIGWVCGSGKEEHIPEEIRTKYPRIEDSNHSEAFKHYKTVYTLGGAGTMQTAINSGAEPIPCRRVLDRDYHTLPKPEDVQDTSWIWFVCLLNSSFNLNLPVHLRWYCHLRYALWQTTWVSIITDLFRAIVTLNLIGQGWLIPVCLILSYPGLTRMVLTGLGIEPVRALKWGVKLLWIGPVFYLWNLSIWGFLISFASTLASRLWNETSLLCANGGKLIWVPRVSDTLTLPFPFGHWAAVDSYGTRYEGRALESGSQWLGRPFALRSREIGTWKLEENAVVFPAPLSFNGLRRIIKRNQVEGYGWTNNCVTLLAPSVIEHSCLYAMVAIYTMVITMKALLTAEMYAKVSGHLQVYEDLNLIFAELDADSESETSDNFYTPERVDTPEPEGQTPGKPLIDIATYAIEDLSMDQIALEAFTVSMALEEAGLDTELADGSALDVIRSAGLICPAIDLETTSRPAPTRIEMHDHIIAWFGQFNNLRLVREAGHWLLQVLDQLMDKMRPLIDLLWSVAKALADLAKSGCHLASDALTGFIALADLLILYLIRPGDARRRLKSAWALGGIFKNPEITSRARFQAEIAHAQYLTENNFQKDYDSMLDELRSHGPKSGWRIGGPQYRPVTFPAVQVHPAQVAQEILEQTDQAPWRKLVIDPVLTERLARDSELGGEIGFDQVYLTQAKEGMITKSLERYRELDPSDRTPAGDLRALTARELAEADEIAYELVVQYPEACANRDWTSLEACLAYEQKKYSPGVPFISSFKNREEMALAGWTQAAVNTIKDRIRNGRYLDQFYHAFGKSQVISAEKLAGGKDPRTVVAEYILSKHHSNLVEFDMMKRDVWQTTAIGSGMPLNQRMESIFGKLAEYKWKAEADATKMDSHLSTFAYEIHARMAYYGFIDHPIGSQLASISRAKGESIRNGYVFAITEKPTSDPYGNVIRKIRGGGTGQNNTSGDNTWLMKGLMCAAWSRYWREKGDWGMARPSAFFNPAISFFANTSDDNVWGLNVKINWQDFSRHAQAVGLYLETGQSEDIRDIGYLGKQVDYPTQEEQAQIDWLWAAKGWDHPKPRLLVKQNLDGLFLRRSGARYYQTRAPGAYAQGVNVSDYLKNRLQQSVGQSYITGFVPQAYRVLRDDFLRDARRWVLQDTTPGYYQEAQDELTRKKLADLVQLRCGETILDDQIIVKHNPSPTTGRLFTRGAYRELTSVQKSRLLELTRMNFPSYARVLEVHCQEPRKPADYYTKLKAKLAKSARKPDEAIRIFTGTLRHWAQELPRKIWKAQPAPPAILPDELFITRRMHNEAWMWHLGSTSIAELEASLAKGPYGGCSDSQSFYARYHNDEQFRKRINDYEGREYILQNHVFLITVLYWFAWFVERSILGLYLLGSVYGLVMFMLVDMSKLYGLLNNIYFHGTGRSSEIISAIVPRDPYIHIKRACVFTEEFIPDWVCEILRFDLMLTFLARLPEIFAEIFIWGQEIKAIPSGERINPWVQDAVIVAEHLEQNNPQQRYAFVSAATGTGKTAMMVPAMALEHRLDAPLDGGKGLRTTWLVVPRKILRDDYIPGDSRAIGKVQKLIKGSKINRRDNYLMVCTYGHLIQRIDGGDCRAEDLYCFDEFHETSGEMILAQALLRQRGSKIVFLSATPRPIPGLGKGFNHIAPHRRKNETTAYKVNGTVSQLYNYGMEIDKEKARRALIVVSTIKEIETVLAGVINLHPGVPVIEVSSRTRSTFATDWAAHCARTGGCVAICSSIIDAGYDFSPPANMLIDSGEYLKVHRGTFVGKTATPNFLREQRWGRVGRNSSSFNGIVISHPKAGTGEPAIQYPSGTLFTLAEELRDDPENGISPSIIGEFFGVPTLHKIPQANLPEWPYFKTNIDVEDRVAHSLNFVFCMAMCGVQPFELQAFYIKHAVEGKPLTEDYNWLEKVFTGTLMPSMFVSWDVIWQYINPNADLMFETCQNGYIIKSNLIWPKAGRWEYESPNTRTRVLKARLTDEGEIYEQLRDKMELELQVLRQEVVKLNKRLKTRQEIYEKQKDKGKGKVTP